MEFQAFKKIFAEYRAAFNWTFYGIGKIQKVHKEYEHSLFTAPVEDCRETVRQFLMSFCDVDKNNFKFPKELLAPLPKATCPCVEVPFGYFPCEEIKQEGKTPMRNYNDSYACASVQTAKSDTAVTRDYLLKRLESAFFPKDMDFHKLFNLGVINTPTSFKDLIDAIKGGKYTINPKIEKQLAAVEAAEGNWYAGPMHGIIWDGPKEDHDGYNNAIADLKIQSQKARDIIMVKDAEAGLAALEAFEAWTPTVDTTTSG